MLLIDNAIQTNLLERYAEATSRLILLDYDGCLVPFTSLPANAKPDAAVLDLLAQLTAVPENDVYIVSGRDAHTLDGWLGHLPLGLVAEHGARIKKRNTTWQTSPLATATGWLQNAEDIMGRYSSNCAGTFIEKKDFSIAWHYRNAAAPAGKENAAKLYEELVGAAEGQHVTVLDGNKVIEVKSAGYNKGQAVKTLTGEAYYELIIAIGDDKTDEDMFAVLENTAHAVTVKVGHNETAAKYRVKDVHTVREFLQALTPGPVHAARYRK